MYSRRSFTKRSLAGLPLSALLLSPLRAAKIESSVRGVKLGLITGSLNPLPAEQDPADAVIAACRDLNVGNVEFVNSLLEPRLTGSKPGGQPPDTITPEFLKSRDEVRQWRLSAPLDPFRQIRNKFSDAGINLFSYVMTFSDDFTEPEIDAVFKQMQALGVRVFCTNQTRVSMGPRLVQYAEKYKISPAFHTHALAEDPNEVASPASLEKLLKMSKAFMVNLDIGHFTAGNQDAVAWIEEHHDRITQIHVKDRKRNNGPNVEWGTGDTPIKGCLTLIRDKRYPIYCIIEREFKGTGTPLEETRKDLEFMQKILA
jgi:hypothetical protein